MRRFELQTNFSHLWWGRKRLCFKYKNTVGLQIFLRRSIRTLNISPLHPSPPLYPFSASPLRLLPLPSSASSPSFPPSPPPAPCAYSPLPFRLHTLPLPLPPSPPPPPPSASSPSPFLEEKDNQNTKRKNESYEFSIQLRTKSTTGIFATGCFWLYTWKISSVAKNKVDNISLDISLVRCANYWAMELNRKKEIPYLSAPMCNSLWLHFYNMLLHCTVGGELKVLLSNRVWFHFSGFSSGDIF